MYLALLNKNEKETFLGMAFNLATADGNYSEEERAIINGYCQEMQCVFYEEKLVKPMDVLIQDIKLNSDNRIGKILVFELIGLAIADGNYDEDERNLINNIMVEFNIGAEFAKNCENLLKKYIAFQTKLNQLVLE